MARSKVFKLPVTSVEKKYLEERAAFGKLNTTDYVRVRLGLPTVRDHRNVSNDRP